MIDRPARDAAAGPADRSAAEGPLVTYLISTYNRRRYLAEALASAVAQTYRNLQIIVVRDGGEEVRDVVDAVGDPRIHLIDRAENRGLSYSYNEALQYAEGKYVAYLGDDDIHYPCHIEKLVGALEGPTDCRAAYSDLYCIVCTINPDGERITLAKSCVASRDYDWWYQIQHNSIPGGSTLHRRDLLGRTGGFDESLRVMIDWDMARRMGFFTDFEHVPEVTGEFYTQLAKDRSDRISDVGRKSNRDFSDNCFNIVWSRPPKPWTKVKDLSVVFLPDRVEPQSVAQIARMLEQTYTPHLLYIPLPQEQLDKLELQYPTVRLVPVSGKYSSGSRLDAVLKRCEGDYVAVVPQGIRVRPYWLENCLHALLESGRSREGMLLQDADASHWAAMFAKRDLLRARKKHPLSSVRRSVEKAGLKLRKPEYHELPLLMDRTIQQAESLMDRGQYRRAAQQLDAIEPAEGDWLLVNAKAAWAWYMDGSSDAEALRRCRTINDRRPILDTLLMEAQLHRRMGNTPDAASRLQTVTDMIAREEPCYPDRST